MVKLDIQKEFIIIIQIKINFSLDLAKIFLIMMIFYMI